jgi:hypothetical protein
MRKSNFVLAAAAILAASAASSAARADALPKEVLGSWCPDTDDGSHTSYKRGKCEDSDSRMTVKPNSVTYWESGCTFSSITTRTQTLFDATYRRPTVSKVFEVKARCSGEGETWNSTLFFNPLGHGALEHQGFGDNELPSELQDKTLCKLDAKTYFEGDSCEGIALRFERDRYTITSGGENIGFCRFTSIKTVWDQNLGVATKLTGGPVTYIAAQCAHTQKLLAMFVSKGTTYVVDKGK